MEVKEILEQRGNNYGTYEDNSRFTQQLKQHVRAFETWPQLTYSQKESVDMIIHKVSRIVNGDYKWLDSWYDIIGYAQLVVDQGDTFKSTDVTFHRSNTVVNHMLRNLKIPQFHIESLTAILHDLLNSIHDNQNIVHWKNLIGNTQKSITELEKSGVQREQY